MKGKTIWVRNVWGESKGDIRLSAFYRYSFDENDKRRDFINGLGIMVTVLIMLLRILV